MDWRTTVDKYGATGTEIGNLKAVQFTTADAPGGRRAEADAASCWKTSLDLKVVLLTAGCS